MEERSEVELVIRYLTTRSWRLLTRELDSKVGDR